MAASQTPKMLADHLRREDMPVELKLKMIEDMLPTNQIATLTTDSVDDVASPVQIRWITTYALARCDIVQYGPPELCDLAIDEVYDRFAIVFHVSLTAHTLTTQRYAGDFDLEPQSMRSLRKQWEAVTHPEKVKRAVIVLHDFGTPDLAALGEFISDFSSIPFFYNTPLRDPHAPVSTRASTEERWLSVELPIKYRTSPMAWSTFEAAPVGWPKAVMDQVAERLVVLPPRHPDDYIVRSFSPSWYIPIIELAKALEPGVGQQDAKSAVCRTVVQASRNGQHKDTFDRMFHRWCEEQWIDMAQVGTLDQACCTAHDARRIEILENNLHVWYEMQLFPSLYESWTSRFKAELLPTCPVYGRARAALQIPDTELS